MTVPRSSTCTSPRRCPFRTGRAAWTGMTDTLDERPLDVDHAQRRLAGDDSYRGLP